MSQLRLVWNCNNSENPSANTTRKFAKCERLPTTSSTQLSLSKKLERLRREQPIAAIMIEKLVDKALRRDIG